MKRLLAALTLLLVPVAANAQAVPLTPPPFGADAQTHALLFDSMLAIARANIQNPASAAIATRSYEAAIQRLQIGDIDAARRDASFALIQAGLRTTTIPVAKSAVETITAPLRALEHPILNIPFTDPRHDLPGSKNPCAVLAAESLRNACAASLGPAR